AANRLSYIYDLHGPSMAVDTACSSSLVALHQACSSLRNGEASTALVGGVNLLLHPYPFVRLTKASMLSADGRCKAFDEAGNGYVRSEGGAVLMPTASLRGGSGFSAFAGAKFALRALAQSMARELGPRGIHVAHPIIDGAIDTAF